MRRPSMRPVLPLYASHKTGIFGRAYRGRGFDIGDQFQRRTVNASRGAALSDQTNELGRIHSSSRSDFRNL
jgi:hypothetical protein